MSYRPLIGDYIIRVYLRHASFVRFSVVFSILIWLFETGGINADVAGGCKSYRVRVRYHTSVYLPILWCYRINVTARECVFIAFVLQINTLTRDNNGNGTTENTPYRRGSYRTQWLSEFIQKRKSPVLFRARGLWFPPGSPVISITFEAVFFVSNSCAAMFYLFSFEHFPTLCSGPKRTREQQKKKKLKVMCFRNSFQKQDFSSGLSFQIWIHNKRQCVARIQP